MKQRNVAVIAIVVFLVCSACSTFIRSSTGISGAPPDSGSAQQSQWTISDDGRYVIFVSFASNLVPNDTNGVADVFRRDNQTGATVRVSLTSSGGQIPVVSNDLSLSGDGDHVAFRTSAALVSSDKNNADDVYVRDVSAGTTEWVSIRPDGTSVLAPTQQGSFQTVSISDNGSRVLMVSSGSPANNGVFLRYRSTHTTAVLAGLVQSAVIAGNGASYVETEICANGDTCTHRSFVAPVDGATPPIEINTECGFNAYDISSDGRFVVGLRFSLPPAWTCPGLNGAVRWDRTTRTFAAVPVSPVFIPTQTTSISNDGRFVAAVDGGYVVRVGDVVTGAVQTPDTSPRGPLDTGNNYTGGISGDGRYVTFPANAMLLPEDTDFHSDVYTRFAMQPGVTAVTPTSVPRGTSHAVLTFAGTELLPGVTATFTATGVTVNSVTLVNPTQLKVDISVSPTAPTGPSSVLVVNHGAFGFSAGGCGSCVTIS